VIFALLIFQGLTAQIITKRDMKSEISSNLVQYKDIPIITMPVFDIQQLIEEDENNKKDENKPLRIAKSFDVNIDIKKEGVSDSIIDLA
jgi:hypothetical protein